MAKPDKKIEETKEPVKVEKAEVKEVKVVKEPEAKEIKEVKIGKKISDKFYWGFRRFSSLTPYNLMKEFGRIWTAILDMKADIEELKGKK